MPTTQRLARPNGVVFSLGGANGLCFSLLGDGNGLCCNFLGDGNGPCCNFLGDGNGLCINFGGNGSLVNHNGQHRSLAAFHPYLAGQLKQAGAPIVSRVAGFGAIFQKVPDGQA